MADFDLTAIRAADHAGRERVARLARVAAEVGLPYPAVNQASVEDFAQRAWDRFLADELDLARTVFLAAFCDGFRAAEQERAAVDGAVALLADAEAVDHG